MTLESDWVDTLLELQELDNRLHQLKMQVQSVPEEKKKAEEELSSNFQEISSAQDQVNEAELKIKSSQLDVANETEHMQKLQKQSLLIKDNVAYRAMLSEVETCRNKISTIEDGELELMEDLEKAQAMLGKAKKAQEATQQRVKETCLDLDTRLTNCNKQTEMLQEKRQSFADKIDRTLLNKYTRIRNSGNGRQNVLVGVHDGNCGYCHLKLTSQEIVDAKKRNIVLCGNCGALIYS